MRGRLPGDLSSMLKTKLAEMTRQTYRTGRIGQADKTDQTEKCGRSGLSGPRTARDGRWRLAFQVSASVVLAGCIAGGAMLYRAAEAVGPVSIAEAETQSVSVIDRDGQLLRAFTTADGRWRLPVEPDQVDPRYLQLLLAFEDRRFHEHGGVDPKALLRAAYQLVRNGRIISGASTLTMQVARLLDGRHERTARGKFRQIVRALKLERRLTKTQILRLYLRLAPFGGNIEGVRAASLAYFGKEPKRLSLGQAALLVALPQSPEKRRPDRSTEAARSARNRVLQRGVDAGVISEPEARRAALEKVTSQRLSFPMIAPHLAEREVARGPTTQVHQVTLQRRLQVALEKLAKQHVQALGRQLSAAILAIDHETGEILAHVGSADYFDAQRLGAIDMVDAIRSPGSTLKPIIYGLAFEAGLAHPETLINDRPTRFGIYAPKNFDNTYSGTVTIREALGRSLNIPAVKVLDAVGPGRLLGRLRRAGLTTTLPEGARPSLPIALGGLGLTLRDLAGMYAALARSGAPIVISHLPQSPSSRPTQAGKLKDLLTPVAAYYVTQILKDAPPPPNARAGRIAYKTGTSYGHRDAWAVGYDGRNTIAVWVGRPDAASTPGLLGRTAAAPILFDAFQRISTPRVRFARAPEGALQRSGADLPEPLKRFEKSRKRSVAALYLDPMVRIAFPPDRSEVEISGRDEPIILKAVGGALPLTWLADGAPIGRTGRDRQLQWAGKSRGFVRISVIDAKGRVDRVTVRVHGR